MCGIAGVWGSDNTQVVRHMMRLLEHRGPDDEGIYRARRSSGILGHRRLSIMDPTGGRQPIQTASGDCAIVANGEIYNFPALRKRLEDRYRFRTGNDSESALHLYEEDGTRAAQQLDGMFAFAIADGEELYLARDPIGVKPLYYGRRDGGFVFASELKALAATANDVRDFPPGSWFHSEKGFHRYYEVPSGELVSLPQADYLQQVRHSVERAVVKRLMSDVPVGAFLSGGLDSSIIAAIARRQLDELHTFSVGVEGSRDLEAARLVADHLDTVHHEYVFTSDEVLAALPEILYHLESFDQDLVRSAVPCHFTSRLAAEHVKVILTGEGADELFAGYDYYRDIADREALHAELRRSVCSLHNVNLQRVDRLTMAHSLEARVPFLDLDVIQSGLAIPPEFKLFRDNAGEVIDKWVLRKAFEDMLPAEIVWRQKEQFDQGSGTTDFLATALQQWMTEDEAGRYMAEHPASRLRSVEECVYHKLLVEAFAPDASAVLANVGRWSHRPDPSESFP